jgi:4-aminobutyrate aminotransferase/(S)-3-amino-2-methylpropionate transaminase
MLACGYVVLTGGPRGDVLTLSPPLTIAPELLSAAAETLADVASS